MTFLWRRSRPRSPASRHAARPKLASLEQLGHAFIFQLDLDSSGGSDPVRNVRIREQDDSMETDEPAEHNLSSADNGLLLDNNDSLAVREVCY